MDNNFTSSLQMKAQEAELIKTKEEALQMKQGLIQGFTDDLEMVKYVDEVLENIPMEKLKNITVEEFDSLFCYKGEKVRFGKNFKQTLDVVCFSKEMNDSAKKFDETLTEMQEDIIKSTEELEAFVKEHGSMSKLVRKQLEETYEKETNPEAKAYKYKLMLAFDDGYTLNDFFDFIKNEPIENVINRRFDANTADALMTRYLKTANKFNLPIKDIKMLQFLALFEAKHLDEKYKDMAGIILVNYMAYSATVTKSKKDRFRMINSMAIGVNIKQLYSEEPEEDLEIFKESLGKILDYIKPEYDKKLATLTVGN